MSVKRVVAIGDSVAWGQGLEHGEKFSSIVTEVLTGRTAPRSDLLARSGAHIGRGNPGEPLEVEDRTARHEVPFEFPTLFQQVESIEDPATVDLVLLTGGINDVEVDTIFNPTTSHAELDRLARRHCFDDMSTLIERVHERCPDTAIAVTGYYPILSDETRTLLIAGSIGTLVGAMIGGPVPQTLAGGVTAVVVERLIANASFVHRRMLYWLRRSVTETEVARVAFVHPGFGAENAVFAGEPFVFNPGEIGDPNVAAARRRGCDEAVESGQGEPGGAPMCYIASLGHPNRRGAQCYAERVLEVLAAGERQSLREPVERLGGGRHSVRESFGRYTLPVERGLRWCLSHLTVDCIRVSITTGANGTDGDVSLELGDRHWMLDRALVDDFEAESTETFVLDPWLDGDPGLLHLWDIDRAVVRIDQFGPFGAKWELDAIDIEINGHRVHSTSPSTSLAGDDALALSYPGGVA